MKHKVTSLYLLCLVAYQAMAQNSEVPSVFKFTPSHVRAIRTGNEVKGYFAYYLLDKKDSKNDNYVLQLFDENLNEVGQKKITMDKTTSLADVQFDGNIITAKFYDTKAKTVNFIAYNGKAEEVGKKTEPASAIAMSTYMNNMKTNTDAPPDFLAMDGVGFVDYAVQKYKGYGFTIDYLSDADIKKGWTYSSDKSSGKFASASFLGASENAVLSMTAYREKMMSTDFTYNVLVLDVKTGKKTSEVACGNKLYNYTPMGAYFDGADKFVLVGQFVKKGDNLLKAPSLGLAVVEYDLTGKVVNEKYTLWKDGLGKFADMKGNKLLDGGYIFFHKIVKAPNGNTVLIGEEFHRAANAAGIVGAVLGGGYGNSVTKLVITDFLFIEMNPNNEVVGLKKISKGASDFAMNGIDFFGPNVAAYMASVFGAFDYDYTTFNEDKSNFSVVYTDYDKLDGSKQKEAYVGNISYDNGKFAVDKVPYKRGENASLYRIYPGKNGYFMLLTYYRKAKKLDFNLVKFNN